MRAPRSSLYAVAACAVLGAGCFVFQAPINASDSARWFLFSHFGADKMCPEMVKHGVALHPQAGVMGSAGGVNIGRFFPTQCHVDVNNDAHTITATIAGDGYAFISGARRVGFTASLAVAYSPDFRLESDDMYVWGRYAQMVTPPAFNIIGVENPVVSLATMTPLGNVAQVLAQGMIASEVARGFTVVRESNGDTFAQGILTPPQKPPHPFQSKDDRSFLEGDTVQIHAQAREYLGPYEITSEGQALFVKMSVSGATPTYYLLEKQAGDAWRSAYERGLPLAAPPAPSLQSGPLAPGDQQFTLPLHAGIYSIVIENGAAVPFTPLGLLTSPNEPVTNLTYQVEVGEKP